MDFSDILAGLDPRAAPAASTDVAQLTTAMVNARMAPELLPYEHELVERVLAQMRVQIEFVEVNLMELQRDRDIKLQLMVVELELERLLYLLRGYLRARLAKIEPLAEWLRAEPARLTRLSPGETAYLEQHLAAVAALYRRQFLARLPPLLQRLDDAAGGESMVEEPAWDRPVFVKVVRGGGSVSVAGEEIEVVAGGIYVVRYEVVREGVLRGDMVMI